MIDKKSEDPFVISGQNPGDLSSFTVIASGVSWAILLLTLRFIAPRFEAIFLDFGVPLPWLTRGVLRASHLLRGPVFWLAAVAVVANVLAFGRSQREEERRSGWWTSLAVLVPVALIVLIILSLGIALLDLGHKLTG